MVATQNLSSFIDCDLDQTTQEKLKDEYLDRQTIKVFPFHLSLCINDIEEARHFYKNVLGIEERYVSKTLVHFDFYGCQLTCYEVPGYSAKNIQREVDSKDAHIPHFGASLSYEVFETVKKRLIAHNATFIKKPRTRFLNTGHEQHVIFIKDPSGHGIEIKSFTKASVETWA